VEEVQGTVTKDERLQPLWHLHLNWECLRCGCTGHGVLCEKGV